MFRKIIISLIVAMCVNTVSVFADIAVTIPAIANSNEDYTFRIKGSNQEFVLLDEGDTNDSKFFVMAKGYYGKIAYHTGGKSKFDPTNPQSMAYFLNNDFLKIGNRSTFTLRYYKLPQAIIDHIDKNHIWECARGKTGSDANEPYKIQCGVAIPSQEELIKYVDKIGWDDNYTSKDNDTSIVPWALRAMHDRGEIMVVRPALNMTMVTGYGAATNGIGIRPVFWLDVDFFREVELDLATMGKSVAQVFKKYYTIDALTDMYSTQECYDYFGYKPELSISVGENNLVNIKNNRSEDIYAIMLTVYYDEGHYPVKQTYTPVYVKADSQINIHGALECDDAVYGKTKIIAKSAPYKVLSNSIEVLEVK